MSPDGLKTFRFRPSRVLSAKGVERRNERHMTGRGRIANLGATMWKPSVRSYGLNYSACYRNGIFYAPLTKSCYRHKQKKFVVHNLTASWRAQHPASQSYQTSGSVTYLVTAEVRVSYSACSASSLFIRSHSSWPRIFFDAWVQTFMISLANAWPAAVRHPAPRS